MPMKNSSFQFCLSNENIKTIKFPILFFDFEAYHILKGSQKKDYFPDINDKPFLLGFVIVQNNNQLKEILRVGKFNYQTFSCWKINNKFGNIWKKFAQIINLIVNKYNIQSFFTLGAKLELEVMNLLNKLKLLSKKTKKVKIYDIYNYYDSLKKSENTNQEDINAILNASLLNLTTENQLEAKKEWNDIWRKLDKIYSFLSKKELQEFHDEYYEQILRKNYTDLLKLLILFDKKYNN